MDMKLSAHLEKYPILAAKENTIYPLLRRLMKEDYVSSSCRKAPRVCRRESIIPLRTKDLSIFLQMSKEWNNLLNAINEIKGE